MAGRPTKAQELGLTEEITQGEDGYYTVILREPDGTVVFDKEGYKSETVAHKAAGYWIRMHYKVHQRRAQRPSPPGQSSQLLTMLRTKAEDSASQALRLRQQADLLEEEAKRLEAAADVLEGTDG